MADYDDNVYEQENDSTLERIEEINDQHDWDQDTREYDQRQKQIEEEKKYSNIEDAKPVNTNDQDVIIKSKNELDEDNVSSGMDEKMELYKERRPSNNRFLDLLKKVWNYLKNAVGLVLEASGALLMRVGYGKKEYERIMNEVHEKDDSKMERNEAKKEKAEKEEKNDFDKTTLIDNMEEKPINENVENVKEADVIPEVVKTERGVNVKDFSGFINDFLNDFKMANGERLNVSAEISEDKTGIILYNTRSNGEKILAGSIDKIGNVQTDICNSGIIASAYQYYCLNTLCSKGVPTLGEMRNMVNSAIDTLENDNYTNIKYQNIKYNIEQKGDNKYVVDGSYENSEGNTVKIVNVGTRSQSVFTKEELASDKFVICMQTNILKIVEHNIEEISNCDKIQNMNAAKEQRENEKKENSIDEVIKSAKTSNGPKKMAIPEKNNSVEPEK